MPDWFRSRSIQPKRGSDTSPAAPVTANVPEGLVVKCQKCGAILFTKDFERDMKVCSKCGHHHRLTADERIAYTVDEGTFVEMDADLISVDPLHFPDYADKIAKGESKSGHKDSLLTGVASIQGHPCVLAVANFDFIGGSMGSVFGEKFARAADRAIEEKLPFIIFCASGGARMHEGLFSLMQMAKTSAAVAQMGEQHTPYIVFLTDPTTGGAFASFAELGDVIYSEPGAYVAFAGTRVAQQAAQHQKLPPNYQHAEFQEEHGMIDRIVPRKEVPLTLARTLNFFGVGGTRNGAEKPTATQTATLPATETAANGTGRNGTH